MFFTIIKSHFFILNCGKIHVRKIKFTILIIVSTQFNGIKYVHTVVHPISKASFFLVGGGFLL